MTVKTTSVERLNKILESMTPEERKQFLEAAANYLIEELKKGNM